MFKNNQAKVFQAGILSGIMLFVLVAIEDWLASGLYTMADPAIWNALMYHNWWVYSFCYHIIVGLILALVYSVFYNSLPDSGSIRGLQFGFWIWIVGTVPGLLMTLMYLAVPEELAIVWLVAGLFNYLLAGLLIGALYQLEQK